MFAMKYQKYEDRLSQILSQTVIFASMIMSFAFLNVKHLSNKRPIV